MGVFFYFYSMKYALFLISIVAISCSKPKIEADINIMVRASVVSEIKQPGSNQLYWKAGIILSKEVASTGTATITWYYPFGSVNGNPSNHYSKTINFSLPGNSNGYYEFTDWKVDNTMIADSIKISSFSATGNYNFTITQ